MYFRHGFQEGKHYQVNPETGCWEWLLSVDIGGYGQVNHRGLNRAAHRTMWEETNGPVPDGLCVCHRCDVRRCINPSHLFLGTYRQNIHDAMQKGRHSAPPRNDHLVGERCSWTKLTDEQIAEIRSVYRKARPFVASDCSSGALARKYGVHRNHILDIVRGKRRTA